MHSDSSLLQPADPAGSASSAAQPRVWRHLIIQTCILIAITLAAVLASEFFGLRFDGGISSLLGFGFVLLPVLLWLVIAVRIERRQPQPRQNLVGTALLCALTAAAVGLPLLQDFFRIEQWLPLEATFQRILGFTLTAGIVDAALKLIVLHFLVFPQSLRRRADAIAYSLAAAVGYSLYLNLALIWRWQPTWDIAGIAILSNYGIQLASSLFIGLGISEARMGRALPIALPLHLLAAAAVSGIITPLVSSLMSGPIGLTGSSDRPLFGLGFVIIALLAAVALAALLYGLAERRERDAYVSAGDVEGRRGAVNRRRRWGLLLGYGVLVLGFYLGVSLRDASLTQASTYTNTAAGITSRYPAGWLLEEGGDYVFRVRDMAHRGFNTFIEVSTLPVSADTVERNLLDRLTLRRSQTLIDYTILGYDAYVLPDGSAAVAMSYSFVARDASPFLEGVSSIVVGLDILTINRGQALIVSFRADSSIYAQELATLDWFIQNLDF